jgi:predicted secreted hydrolase
MQLIRALACPSDLPRRRFLGAGLGSLGLWGLGTCLVQSAQALEQTALVFPRDAGAHPDFRTEWWYVTGTIKSEGAAPDAAPAFGFQVTFFRSRIANTQGMQSQLAARQLIFAHAALTDINGKKLWHDQRIARASGAEPGKNPLDTASASLQDTSVVLRDWSLQRQGEDLRAQIDATDFSLALSFTAKQPVLLQGDHGVSRKGPDPKQTSYYYSLPHLQVNGTLVLQGKRHVVGAGSTAWLDHEWSKEMLPPGAAGWDWLGINLLDGSALTAFRVRDKSGGALWDGGSLRTQGKLFNFQHGEVVFQPLRVWKSALSQASYPVEWTVHTPTDIYTVRAVLDNQELDSRTSTGAIYWEGLCEVWNSVNKLVGRGYLEMTGYAAPIRL